MYIYGRTGERVAEYMIVGFAMQPEFFALKGLYKITANKKEEVGAGSLFYRCQSRFPISLAGGVEKLNRIR